MDYTMLPWPDDSYFAGDIPFPEEAADQAIIHICTEEEYHRIRAFSSGYLKSLIDGTPQHALVPVSQTPAMSLGVAFETLAEDAFTLMQSDNEKLLSYLTKNTLQNHSKKFLERCCIKPLDLNKGAGAHAKRDAWKAENAGKTVVSLEVIFSAMQMLKSALANNGWQRHLRGQWQVIILWVEDGLPMKAMLDHHYENLGLHFGVDIKTIGKRESKASADPHNFSRRAAGLQMDLQAAHYMSAMMQIFGEDKIAPFIWLVVEQQAPHGTAVYVASEAMCQTGYQQREYAIENLRAFIQSQNRVDEFPVYSHDDVVIEPPRYHSYRTAELEGNDE